MKITATAFLQQKFGTGWSRKALCLPIPDLLDIINEYGDFRERCFVAKRMEKINLYKIRFKYVFSTFKEVL